MDAVSVDNAPWIIAPDPNQPTLEIALLRESVILAWSQFVYAEGSDDAVRIAFATHDVLVRGTGLSALLRAITAHQVTSIQQPGRTDWFPSRAARSIREIEVGRIDAC